ncbi:MAG: riboflavin biosynthesis protein RibF [Candidatus Tyrphobacter sp.]
MKIFRTLERERDRPLALAIGFFDGLHIGHREIVRAALRMRKPGWRSGVLTFSNHPSSYLRPGTEPPLLFTSEERLDRFAAIGVEECFFVPFDEHVATMEPAAFLQLLEERLHVRGVAIGETFRYGHKRAGDVAGMRAYYEGRDVAVAAEPSVTLDGERVCSTRIRALVLEGEMERAEEMLGEEYELRGVVELGAGRGLGLGFPTANVRTGEKLLPKDGVYSGIARHDGRDYAALISIGTNPHFGGTARTVEAWLRDFAESIYGREIALRGLRFIREQRAFSSAAALVDQMREDRQTVAYPSFP